MRNVKRGKDRSQVEENSTEKSQSPAHVITFITDIITFFSKNTSSI